MTTARYIVADVFEGLASLSDDSVDLVLSSPPFLALRSYLPADHPDKAKEIGSEPTPADFLDTLIDVVEACDRVLAPHGSLVFELGDTYSGSGGGGGDYLPGGLRENQPGFGGSAERQREGNAEHWRQKNAWKKGNGPFGTDDAPRPARSGREIGWPMDKSLTGIPTLFAWSLAYGRNLLRPERTTEPWRIRNVVAWVRPNPPVGALGDKFRPATSYLTVACKARDRYFDLDAVRTALTEPNRVQRRTKGSSRDDGWGRPDDGIVQNQAGAPPLDYWEIPTQPFSGSHYATFPEALCTRPIESMCPRRVCTECGEPSRRITETGDLEATESARMVKWDRGKLDNADAGSMAEALRAGGFIPNHVKPRTTLGWTDCGHDSYRRGCVLDPFAGSGTTLQVATGHGRDAIGIDLHERNADLARERVGMWLTVEHLEAVAS